MEENVRKFLKYELVLTYIHTVVLRPNIFLELHLKELCHDILKIISRPLMLNALMQLHGVSYTVKSRLNGVRYTGESPFHGVWYTMESPFCSESYINQGSFKRCISATPGCKIHHGVFVPLCMIHSGDAVPWCIINPWADFLLNISVNIWQKYKLSHNTSKNQEELFDEKNSPNTQNSCGTVPFKGM